jgi:carbon monoxide dehydrogenase subunit G
MELTNEFTVSVPVDEAWRVLTDVERIAPCMPGAELQEIEGDEYRGIVKVKVGPITAQYKGKATFESQDEAAGKVVLKAEGRDTRGQGNASALITATLEPTAGGTKVSVVTDLTVTGKVAQFGRGVLADVSGKLLTQFVECVESKVLVAADPSPPDVSVTQADGSELPDATPVVDEAPPGAETPPPVAPSPSQVRKIESAPAQPVDLLGTAGAPVVKRVGPIIGVLVVVLWLLRRRKR